MSKKAKPLPHCNRKAVGGSRWTYRFDMSVPQCPLCYSLFGPEATGYIFLATHLQKEHRDDEQVLLKDYGISKNALTSVIKLAEHYNLCKLNELD